MVRAIVYSDMPLLALRVAVLHPWVSRLALFLQVLLHALGDYSRLRATVIVRYVGLARVRVVFK